MTPITNPTGTLIHNSICMISAGNAVVFNAHPNARETSVQTIKAIHRAIVEAGGPAGLIGSVPKPTLDTAKELIEHPKVNMLVATGGRPVVNVVLRSGKKAIGAGAGNPPVVVDETANIRRAAACIVNGASMNNNIFCTSEKEVIVVDAVADALIKFMQETGKVVLAYPRAGTADNRDRGYAGTKNQRPFYRQKCAGDPQGNRPVDWRRMSGSPFLKLRRRIRSCGWSR